MTMSTTKACGYFFCFTGFKFLLCIYQFYFWFGFLTVHTTIWADKPIWCCKPLQSQTLPWHSSIRYSIFPGLPGSNLLCLWALLWLFSMCFSHPYWGSFIKENSFIFDLPFGYSSILTFLTITHCLLTTYPSTLISSMQVRNDIKYKCSSFRCFYTFKFEGVNKILSVFSSFSLGNFSTLSSNWVSTLSKHCLFPSLYLKVQTFCFSNSHVAVLLELPSWKILQWKTVASAVSQLSSNWELNKGSWPSIPDRFYSPFLPSSVKSQRFKAVTLWFTLVLILTPSVGWFFC